MPDEKMIELEPGETLKAGDDIELTVLDTDDDMVTFLVEGDVLDTDDDMLPFLLVDDTTDPAILSLQAEKSVLFNWCKLLAHELKPLIAYRNRTSTDNAGDAQTVLHGWNRYLEMQQDKEADTE